MKIIYIGLVLSEIFVNKVNAKFFFCLVYIDFSDALGQLTLQSVVESRPNSNLHKLLGFSLVTCQNKKIQSNTKALEC